MHNANIYIAEKQQNTLREVHDGNGQREGDCEGRTL